MQACVSPPTPPRGREQTEPTIRTAQSRHHKQQQQQRQQHQQPSRRQPSATTSTTTTTAAIRHCVALAVYGQPRTTHLKPIEPRTAHTPSADSPPKTRASLLTRSHRRASARTTRDFAYALALVGLTTHCDYAHHRLPSPAGTPSPTSQ